MAAQNNKALAARFHGEIFQQGRVELADEICAADFRWYAPGFPPEGGVGPQFVKQFANTLRSAFPGLALRTDDSIAEGDKVVERWTMQGTHQGEFQGTPPTGKQVTVTGIDIFRISGGKLAELRQEVDNLGMLQQLGVIPAPGHTGS
jgi:steroid delta-isomerase-like uncharacterized protein